MNQLHLIIPPHEQYLKKSCTASFCFSYAVLVVCGFFFSFVLDLIVSFFDSYVTIRYNVIPSRKTLFDFFLDLFQIEMTEWREFRPQQQLLNSNFDGYRLTLEPLAQYTLKFNDPIHVQKDYQLDNDLYTFNGIKGFKSSNQLYLNPWKETNDLYFFDQTHSIQQINLSSNESLSYLQQPINIYQLPRNTLHASMIFITDSLVIVCDGRSNLFVLNTNNTPKWKVLHEQDFDEFVTSPIRLLHAVCHQGFIHAIIGFLQTDCQLLWITFSIDSSNEIKLTRRRIVSGKKWPDFVALESHGQGIYIAAEGLYKFTFDSLIEVNE